MSTFLVTGGCGFIGSHLADALVNRGDRVRILDDLSTGRIENAPSEAEIMVGDVADPEKVAEAMTGVDGCFHLAAVASVQRCNEEWLYAHRVNIGGTVAVFDAARRVGPQGPVPVIYASSAAVYGDNPAVPLAETAPAHPLTAYGADKLGCEWHGRVATRIHGVPTVGFRFFNVYGPRQDPDSPYSGVIAIFAARIRKGDGVDIFGDGEQVRDFVYVADVVRYLIAAMDRPPAEPEVYNVCTGRATTVRELAETIATLCGRKADISHCPPRPGDIKRSIGDPARAAAAFGFTADTLLADGLRPTLAADA